MSHKIGDWLYALATPYDSGDDYVEVYPVAALGDRYVWVYDALDIKQRQGRLDRRARLAAQGVTVTDPIRMRRIRLDRAELEREGCAYSRSCFQLLHTEPGLDWPMFVLPATGRELSP